MLNSTIYEYLAIIAPEDPVKSDIEAMKQSCKTDYGWKTEAGTKPHLTLFSYLGNAESENILIKNLAQITTQTPIIAVKLSGFDCFAGNQYTIYVKVEEDLNLSRLLKALKKILGRPLKAGNKADVYTSTRAHLSIAKGISRSDFEKAWPNWKDRIYKGAFTADRLLLLRRTPGSMYRSFDKVAELYFQGNQIESTQTRLF